MYSCPVCQFDRLPFPPDDYRICPCCGTEFGIDDAAPTAAEVRARRQLLGRRWLAQGGAFWSSSGPPDRWDRDAQIGRLRLQLERIVVRD